MPSSPSDLLLLASAVAGRRATVHVARESDSLEHAYSDGQMIVLPSLAAREEDAWMHVVAQALLIAAGSLDPALLRRLVGRPAAARRYAWFEAARAAELLRSRVPPAIARALLATPVRQAGSADSSASLSLALSQTSLTGIPAFVGTVRPMTVLRGAVSQRGWKALQNPSARRMKVPEQPTPETIDEPDTDEATDESKLLKLFSNPFAGRNPIADLVNQILGSGGSRTEKPTASDGGEGAEMPIGRIERAWRRGANAIRAYLPMEVHEPDLGHEPTAAVYPEWDGHALSYRRNWVCVDEVDPWNPNGPRDLSHVLKDPSMRLRRELARLPLDYEMHRRQRDGVEFDIGRLVEHAADLRTGDASSAPDVYRASRRTRRDLGVVVVMDASGSTDERNERGESVFEHHAGTAYRLARTLDSLGDRVGFYGFQSWGRQLVHMVRLKGHEEAWSGRVAQRLEHLETVGFTRTGAAVRHADRLLRTQIRLPHRLMVMITDGLSYDTDYEGAYAEDDTRQALAEARAQGTACVCICIGGSVEAPQLARIFGNANLLMVDDSAQIDTRLRAVCARALSEVRRRKLSRAAPPQPA